jgi:hypothetical protein
MPMRWEEHFQHEHMKWRSVTEDDYFHACKHYLYTHPHPPTNPPTHT